MFDSSSVSHICPPGYSKRSVIPVSSAGTLSDRIQAYRVAGEPKESEFGMSRSERVDVLLVCQPGGHLEEMLALEEIWSTRTRAWLTLRSPDTISALAEERVFFGYGPTPRSFVRFVLNSIVAATVLARVRPRCIITTGASLAVSTAWIGRLLGAKTIYVECAGRVNGVSLSMRLVAPVARKALFVQWPDQVNEVRGASFHGMIARPERPSATPSSRAGPVVATVGTAPYPFDRFVELVDELAASTPLFLQKGLSQTPTRHAMAVDFLDPEELAEKCASAPAIVTHGGIGSARLAWKSGLRPIIIPRRMALGEQVDDHQIPFAHRLEQLGLAYVAEDLETLRERVAATPDEAPLPPSESYSLVEKIEHLLQSSGV